MNVSDEAVDITLNSLADKLFGSLLNYDYETAATCFSPDATWWKNGVLQGTVTDVLAKRKTQEHPLGPHHHEDVRRLFSANGFVQQFVNRWTGPDNEPKALHICAVFRVNAEYRVTLFEEYYDKAVREAGGALWR